MLSIRHSAVLVAQWIFQFQIYIAEKPLKQVPSLNYLLMLNHKRSSCTDFPWSTVNSVFSKFLKKVHICVIEMVVGSQSMACGCGEVPA